MVTVFLVDDHSVFRSGVRAELAEHVEIIGDAGTVAEAIEGINRLHPDVVLLDVHMPNGGGLAVIKGTQVDTVFLALSVSDAAEDVIAIIRAGARGYVTKNIAGSELAQAITRVHSGDAYFSPRLAGFVLDAFAGGEIAKDEDDLKRATEHDPLVDALTRRELEVLRLLARGYTYKEIAKELFISIKTVETHASNILRKTQQSNRYALSRWAQERSLD
ncbi:LuxR C-terminal-related transcriptional regulator [Corynebacterium caspium]|uniref:LuxR C-terminal-related transcriptional regulator n=1 Tax=Corynebacterium caspium TaxID=234828 RepID=UPI00039CB143|nr:response regulator transcription factor [Corynebacterium caspium]